jgi:CheY-like chemotaxis protein
MQLGAPILIIDDDPVLTELVQEILQTAGHDTAVARHAFHGLRLARELQPSVVLCDWVMPDMAGSDVLRALAADPATARIPRVLMTGHADADQSCADGFLLKPFPAPDLLWMLEQMSALPRVQKKSFVLKEASWQG